MDQGVSAHLLGWVGGYGDYVYSNCTASGQTGHETHTQIVCTNIIDLSMLNADGSCTIQLLESAVALPQGTATDGGYTTFAQCWFWGCEARNRIFFYFTVNGNTYNYISYLQTGPACDISTIPSCYDKATAAEFGWDEKAQRIYNEYFGSGAHNDILQLTHLPV